MNKKLAFSRSEQSVLKKRVLGYGLLDDLKIENFTKDLIAIIFRITKFENISR